MPLRREFIRWLPPLLWATVIFCLSARSHPPNPGPEFPLKDKLGHLALYAILGWLVTRALRRAPALSLPKAAIAALLITSAYGASDEFHQRFVPQRTCDPWDWTADTLGGGLAVAGSWAQAVVAQKTRKTTPV